MASWSVFLNKGKGFSLENTLDRCACDEERAKSLIFKTYYGYVSAVIKRYIKTEESREELINECFVKVFHSIRKFEKKGEGEVLEKSFRGWLARIATNLAIDFLRSQKAIFVSLDDDLSYKMKEVYVDDAHQLHVQDILKLLDKLPDIQKHIFNMYEIEGFSHEEIAAALRIPESTSRTYLTRAKQKLRQYYTEATR